MDEQKVLTALIDDLKKELEAKDEIIKTQKEMIDGFSMYGSEWIDAQNYKEAIQEARDIENKYRKAYQEILIIKEQYQKALKQMVLNL